MLPFPFDVTDCDMLNLLPDDQHIFPRTQSVHAHRYCYVFVCVTCYSIPCIDGVFTNAVGRYSKNALPLECPESLLTYLTATVQSQLRTVPPYVLGAVWILFNAYYCYRKNQRAIPILFSTLLIVLGYAMAVGTKNSHARYGVSCTS